MSTKTKQRKRSPRKPAPTVITFRDKLQLLGILLGGFTLLFWVFITVCKNQQSAAVDRTLMRWQQEYHLTAGQVESLRAIELSFHGNGNPFTGFHTPNKEKTHQHHVMMSELMTKEDGARFLQAMERSAGNH